MIQNVKKDENKILQQKKEFSEATFQKLWQEYYSKIDSATVKAALRNIIFEIADTTLNVIVPNERIREVFVQDKSFSDKLGEAFLNQQINLHFEIDLSRFPDLEESFKPQKTLTIQEKYVELLKINPKLEDFRQRFKLKIDK